jgi:cytochrome c oxidase cbb3-type subunit III
VTCHGGQRALCFAALAVCAVFVASAAAQPPAQGPTFDAAAVERGRELLASQCGFCHGPGARGGSGGPDLTRSALVQGDENGKQLGEFLRVGRPDRGMPKFELSESQTADLATFLHSTIYLAANRRLYRILDIVTGDARAGEAFFNGAGRCSGCHSPSRDLKGIGSRYDPATLRGRLLLPRGGLPGAPPQPAYRDKNAITATVTMPGGDRVTGAIVRLTDFDVVLYNAATRQMRSWLRAGDTPNVAVADPLQAHVDLLPRWTDEDMHNMTAYLASLR